MNARVRGADAAVTGPSRWDADLMYETPPRSREPQRALPQLPRVLRSLGKRGREGDLCLVLVLVAWTVWVLCSMLWAGAATLGTLRPFLLFPVALIGGVLVGRRLSRWETSPVLPAVLAGAVGIVLLAVPFYANAQAAWGLQLMAWSGLLALQLPAAGPSSPRPRWTLMALGMLVLAGALLVSRAQATSVLVVPFALLALSAVVLRWAPQRLPVGIIGLSTVGAAAVAVVSLAGLPAWPEALNAGRSLSSTRHRLWADALELWQAEPVTGGGPGAFLAHSELAASNPMLERAHSSILQVGAELGSVGVILFLAILVAGAAVALQEKGSSGMIAVTAWCALGIHSMIDHLYEYPLVVFTAGVVLGIAGQRTQRDTAE